MRAARDRVRVETIADARSACSFNHGQCCCAGSRIFVHENIYDEFLKRFTEQTKTLKVGDPFSPGTFQGPQINQQQYDVSLPEIARC